MTAPQALSQEEIDNLLSSMNSPGDDSKGSNGGGNTKASSSGKATESDKQGLHIFRSGKVLDNKNFKVYNFRRPDKFSKDQLRALQSIHENFSRQCAMAFASYLRMSVEIDVLSVDQLTYDEFIRSMPSPISVNILEMNPLPGKVLMGFGHEITTSLIDRMLGGTGKAELDARELTDIENMLLKRVFEHTYGALEDAWKSFCSVKIKLVGTEDSYALIQVATPSEIVALVTFEVVFGQRESGLMSLCIPYPVLEGMMGNLSAQHIMHRNQAEANPEEQDKLLSKLNFAKTPVDVIFGHMAMPILDLLQVRVGDVLPLDNRLDDDVIIRINNKAKFTGKPGTLGRKIATYVLDPIENIDALEEGI